MLPGVAASPGLAIGTIHVVAAAELAVPDEPVDLGRGGAMLDEALRRTRAQMTALIDDTTRRLGAGDAAIFKAQADLLDDTDLITLTCQLMVEGHGVAWSWHQAVSAWPAVVALGNPVLAARGGPARCGPPRAGRRSIRRLPPARSTACPRAPMAPCVLVAADLSPSDTAALDPAKVAGIATALGGPTSHSAILARTLGLPSVVALGASAGAQAGAKASSMAMLAASGSIPAKRTSPAAGLDRSHRRPPQGAGGRAQPPAITTDGHQVAIAANVNRPDRCPLPWPKAPRAWA
jgi:phosphocarrier protein FPr